jgi:hypothetical protein
MKVSLGTIKNDLFQATTAPSEIKNPHAQMGKPINKERFIDLQALVLTSRKPSYY